MEKKIKQINKIKKEEEALKKEEENFLCSSKNSYDQKMFIYIFLKNQNLVIKLIKSGNKLQNIRVRSIKKKNCRIYEELQ